MEVSRLNSGNNNDVTQCVELVNSNNNLQVAITSDKLLENNVLVVKDNDIVVGCVAYKKLNFYLQEVKYLSVKAEYRRGGIGKSLLSKALQAIKNDRGREVFLTVRDDNSAGKALYNKIGFVPVDKFNNNDRGIVLVMLFNTSTNEIREYQITANSRVVVNNNRNSDNDMFEEYERR